MTGNHIRGKNMKFLFESWRMFLEQEGEETDDLSDIPDENILDLSTELDSGFCEFNPVINQYAQSSPEAMAEMLIFVVATQRSRWYDVVEKFPILMAFITKHNALLDPEQKITKDGKDFYQLPKEISALTLGFRKNAIQKIWENRESFYKSIMEPINRYNRAAGPLEKEEAMFEVYTKLLTIPGLGLPKAAFATQLIIGRMGCIDSINMNLYKGLDPEGKLIKVDKKTGIASFRGPGKRKEGGKVISLTGGGIRLAKNYVEFLRAIADTTKAANISRQLWNSWVEMVARKTNVAGDLAVIMPSGEKFRVPNDYSRRRSKEYLKGDPKATGSRISREHDPRELTEAQKAWSSYFYKTLNEQVK
jgi:hypothetical protein